MRRFASSRPWGRVVIAGGGFAALETLLALRALGDDWARVELIAPSPTFEYRPAATMQAFDPREARNYDLQAIAADLGATFHRARLQSVSPQNRYVRHSSGARLSYDDLVLAIGARASAGIAGALTFRDQRDLPLFDGVLRDVLDGAARRLVFALPEGRSYPVPLYELALLCAGMIADHDLNASITIVSPEAAPLAAFGDKPSRVVADLLAQRGVSFVGRAQGCQVRRGALVLGSGDVIEADRVVAVPRLSGPRITGVPTDPYGFVPTDADGRVVGLRHVYAAGDMTTFPVKQGGIATQQADRIAEVILTAGGAGITPVRIPRVLQARLLGGEQPLFLRAELDDLGEATSATLARPTPEASIDSKVIARYLSPYLAAREPNASRTGPAHPSESMLSGES